MRGRSSVNRRTLKLSSLTLERKQQCTKFEAKILTYNIFLLPPPIKNKNDDYKKARLKEFIKLIKQYDIICLQDVFGFLNHRKQKLIRHALRAGFIYFAESPSPSFFSSKLVDGGLVTLSKYEMIV